VNTTEAFIACTKVTKISQKDENEVNKVYLYARKSSKTMIVKKLQNLILADDEVEMMYYQIKIVYR
jgi:hypothetical protein